MPVKNLTSLQTDAPRNPAFRLATAASRAGADPGTGWMITLSDLTLLLLGFAALWQASSATPAWSPVPTAAIAPAAAVRSKPLVVDNLLEAETWQAVHNDLTGFVSAAGLAQDVTVEAAPGEILLSMRDSVPFDSGKADLRAQALPVLEKIAQVVLSNSRLSVAVSGHTDNRRIANPAFPSNWELSTARASRVARFLIQRGLRPSRIAVQGYADHRPKKPNSTPTNRRANRRVEIRLFQEPRTS